VIVNKSELLLSLGTGDSRGFCFCVTGPLVVEAPFKFQLPTRRNNRVDKKDDKCY